MWNVVDAEASEAQGFAQEQKRKMRSPATAFRFLFPVLTGRCCVVDDQTMRHHPFLLHVPSRRTMVLVTDVVRIGMASLRQAYEQGSKLGHHFC